MTQIPLDKLESILDRSSELEKSLSSELSSEDYVKFSKEYSEIEPLKNAIVDWKKFQAESEELNDIINDDSSDAKKTAAFAISIGSASFLNGICFTSFSSMFRSGAESINV